MHVYEKVVDLLVAVILLFLVPLLYLGKRTELLTQMQVSGYTRNFIEDVVTHGYVTKEMLEEFRDKVYEICPEIYVELSVQSYLYEPIYQGISGDMNYSNRYQTYWTITTNEEIVSNLYSTRKKQLFKSGDYLCVKVWTVVQEKKELVAISGQRIRELPEIIEPEG